MEKVSIVIRVFLHEFDLELILICNGEVLKCFLPFSDLFKCIRCTIYFKQNNRLTFSHSYNFRGKFLGNQTGIPVSKIL